MLLHPGEGEVEDIDLMDRQELIRTLLEFNDSSTFCFTRAWLEWQWTKRLRTLLRAAKRQSQAKDSYRVKEEQMLLETLTPAARAELERTLERRLIQRTWGRIRRLRVEVNEDRVVVHGSTPSYYVKQLALAAILDTLGATPVEEDLEVGAGGSRTPLGHARR